MNSRDGRQTTTRRRVLLGMGAGTTVALAGCLGGGSGGAESVPVLGDPDADVVLEVYEDFGCPHCQSFNQNGFPEIQSQYLEAGHIRYEHRDFVVTGDPARQAASAAREVLNEHGNEEFWTFAKALYDNQNRLGSEAPGLFSELAENQGLDGAAIATAGEDRTHSDAVQADKQRGESFGVQGTPSFVLDGSLVDMSGAGTIQQQTTILANEIDAALQ